MKINLDPMPARSSSEVQRLVEQELAGIQDAAISARLRSFLIPPRKETRVWEWSIPNQSFPVWIVAKSQAYDSCILFSDYGFGPAAPWGLESSSQRNFGADFGWFGSLQTAYGDSWLSEEHEQK